MIETWSEDELVKQWRKDELLLYITGAASDLESPHWCRLKEQANAALHRRFHYLQQHLGFTSDGQPFVLLEFENWQKDAFEMRWLMRRAMARIKSVFASDHALIFLGGANTALQQAFAEDSASLFSDELTEIRDFKSWRLAAMQTKSWDPVRSKNLLGYRRWINEEPDSLTSLAMAERLLDFAKSNGCQAKVLSESELVEEGMNLLLAVGQASQRSPSRLIVLQKNVNQGSKPLVLVGKGITFDTGGINVKPFASHVNCMKNDMGGAALMAHLFMALVAKGYSKPLVLVIPACENLVAEKAMKPGALVKSHKGKKVLIDHTDAEGRLILADAISYANKYYNPQEVLVAATLTTASLRQFSGYYTPVHFANHDLQAKLTKAGEQWGEKFIYCEELLAFAAANRTKAADLTNMGRLPGHAHIGGGSNVAAHFLKEFSDAPLTHFDIFASCWNWSGDYPGSGYGATGAPFNSLLTALS